MIAPNNNRTEQSPSPKDSDPEQSKGRQAVIGCGGLLGSSSLLSLLNERAHCCHSSSVLGRGLVILLNRGNTPLHFGDFLMAPLYFGIYAIGMIFLAAVETLLQLLNLLFKIFDFSCGRLGLVLDALNVALASEEEYKKRDQRAEKTEFRGIHNYSPNVTDETRADERGVNPFELLEMLSGEGTCDLGHIPRVVLWRFWLGFWFI